MSMKTSRSPKTGTKEQNNKRPASSPPSLNANEPKEEGEGQQQKRQCHNENYRKANQASVSKSSFHKLGEQINNLVKMLEDGKRRSIHQPMRDTIESLKNLYESSAIESHDETAKQVIRKNISSQTSPWQKLAAKPAEKSGPNSEMLKHNLKTPEPGTSTETGKTETNTHQNHLVEGQETVSGWTRVVRKPKRKKKPQWKNKRLRPEAIMITTIGDISYADMLKKIKSEPELKEFGESVSKIRKTAKGDLLLTLQGNPSGRANNYKGKLEEFLQDSARIKALCEEKTIECRDLDEITTKTELCNALTTQFPKIGVLTEENIKRLHTTREGTQTAYISVPARDANVILEKTHVRVGWVSCRLRGNITPTRCYRCLNFGHVARHCRSEDDRTGECLQCGGKGHKAKECKAPPKCVLCNPGSGNQHASGSYKCQAYKNAVKALINNHV